MQKQCNLCQAVVGADSTLCPRCGSQDLNVSPTAFVSDVEPTQISVPFRVYKFSFALGALIEGSALILLLGEAGMRHSANAPMSDGEMLVYILHFPTILLSWALGSMFAPFVPITQLIFWTYLFAGIWKKFRKFPS